MRPKKPTSSLLDSLPEGATVKLIRVEPGDIIVVSFNSAMTDATVNQILSAAQECFPQNRVIALDGGASLSIYRLAQSGDAGATLRPGHTVEVR